MFRHLVLVVGVIGAVMVHRARASERKQGACSAVSARAELKGGRLLSTGIGPGPLQPLQRTATALSNPPTHLRAPPPTRPPPLPPARTPAAEQAEQAARHSVHAAAREESNRRRQEEVTQQARQRRAQDARYAAHAATARGIELDEQVLRDWRS